METLFFDQIADYQSEDTMSVNHSKLINRLCVALDRYNEEYDVLPELELDLSGPTVPNGKCKPDLAIYPSLHTNWFNDLIFYTKPPLTAIEILSPKQGVSDLTDKAFKLYFPAGVSTVWLVVPGLHIAQILLPDSTQLTWTSGTLIDPITNLSVDIDHLFR